jgi:hypothetical protein
MPDAWFRAEYLGEFTETEQSVFAYDHVMAALTDEVIPLFPSGAPTTELPPVAIPNWSFQLVR